MRVRAQQSDRPTEADETEGSQRFSQLKHKRRKIRSAKTDRNVPGWQRAEWLQRRFFADVFGAAEQARPIRRRLDRAAAHENRVHERVRGAIRESEHERRGFDAEAEDGEEAASRHAH